jgi:hypothetical protein
MLLSSFSEVPEVTTSLGILSSSAVFAVAVVAPWIIDSSLSICPLAMSAAVDVLLP